MKTTISVETVTDRIGEHVLASTVREANDEDIELAKHLHSLGKCPHNVVLDEEGWLYDFRSCYTCGKGLGTV